MYCATFNNKVENHLIVEVVRHQKVVVELDRWRDGGTDQHVNRVQDPITKTHPTLTPTWKLQCNEVDLDEFSLFWPFLIFYCFLLDSVGYSGVR